MEYKKILKTFVNVNEKRYGMLRLLKALRYWNVCEQERPYQIDQIPLLFSAVVWEWPKISTIVDKMSARKVSASKRPYPPTAFFLLWGESERAYNFYYCRLGL